MCPRDIVYNNAVNTAHNVYKVQLCISYTRERKYPWHIVTNYWHCGDIQHRCQKIPKLYQCKIFEQTTQGAIWDCDRVWLDIAPLKIMSWQNMHISAAVGIHLLQAPVKQGFDVFVLLAWMSCWKTVELPVLSDAIVFIRVLMMLVKYWSYICCSWSQPNSWNQWSWNRHFKKTSRP